jgi:hypothetical protein
MEEQEYTLAGMYTKPTIWLCLWHKWNNVIAPVDVKQLQEC